MSRCHPQRVHEILGGFTTLAPSDLPVADGGEQSYLGRIGGLLLVSTALVSTALVSAVLVSILVGCSGEERPVLAAARAESSAPVAKTFIAHEVARPLIDAHAAALPHELAGKSSAEQAAAWPAWVARHDEEIRARLAQGDEDSVVNLWLYGTSFTALPRASDHTLVGAEPGAALELIEQRLRDLIQAAAAPGDNERAQFVRALLARQGIDPALGSGPDQAREYLTRVRARVVHEHRAQTELLEAARSSRDAATIHSASASLFRERGLSSDTSILTNFSLDSLLRELKHQGRLRRSQVQRVAIIGPGLDFTDKGEGYDFYPLQTIQPFAVVDSLVQLGLASPDLTIATFDLSHHVNEHLAGVRQRAEAGTPYTLQLPLEEDDASRQWNPALVRYWKQLGAGIGDDVPPIPPPQGIPGLRVRAVRVRPSIAAAIRPFDLNIVVERTRPGAEPFDLIIATNILVYYDEFEQALALANVAAMLGRDGYFLTNYVVAPPPPLEPHPSVALPVHWDALKNGDTMLAFRLATP